jgi:aldose 1-epimerase
MRAREGNVSSGARGVTVRPFGMLPDGQPVELYSIANGGIELEAITFGAIVVSLRVPDPHGRIADVVLGHGDLDAYVPNPSYLGAIVGRYANRIALGRLRLDGVVHQLNTNDGAHHLHGGLRGFDQRVWVGVPLDETDGVGVTFTRTSPAGEEHYPGTLDISVTYLLTAGNTIVLHYEATSDAPTIVNLTQHSYFNLAGETSTSVLDHELTIHAASYTPVDSGLIPTGEIAPVAHTPFDFRTPARIGSRIMGEHEQLRLARGFDHNFVLVRTGDDVAPAATLRDPGSGRVLDIATTEPGLQFYGGHLLNGRVTGAYGRPFRPNAGLCLETQHFPDSPNQQRFPSVILRPGERYRSTTTWRFTAV